jgi:hypothetical protein
VGRAGVGIDNVDLAAATEVSGWELLGDEHRKWGITFSPYSYK